MKRFRSPATHPDAVAVDVHQHLWPEALVDALRRRTTPPRLRGWVLELDDERPHAVDPVDHDPVARRGQAVADGFDLVFVSLSSALGIETLPPSESDELLDAYHEGALEFPSPVRAWASACLTEIDPAALERRIDQGFVGLQLPATALLDEVGYARVAPLLEVLEERGRPLFIHPGPPGELAATVPTWWPAIVSYVQQMHAAWFAFRAYGRPAFGGLRACFALLAGLAPLHGERLLARAGERTAVDPDVFLDVSSYGTRAIDATVRVLGVDVLVNGSDRPYAAPVRHGLGDAVQTALRSTNPIRLLALKEVINVMDVPAGARS
jgi:amidohydrolase family protein